MIKIDLVKLASTIGNKDIENLELCGWGFYDFPADFKKEFINNEETTING